MRNSRTRHAVAILSVAAASMPSPAMTQDEMASIAAHERVAKSVVLVLVRTAGDGDEPIGVVSGSGFAVEPGLVVTNYHVVRSAEVVEVVTHSGDSERAEVVGTAPGFDLALLRVPFDTDALPSAPFETSLDLRIGQRVLACSHPLGLQHSMTSGIVSGLRRRLPGLELGPSIIQFDNALNPGQSGGPLVDTEGRVVGVTTAKRLDAEGIAYAIPIEVVVRAIPDLKAMGHVFRPRLGLEGVAVDPDLARLFALPAPRGFLVEAVEPGSPAHRAGLRAGTRHVALRGRDFVLGGDLVVAANGVPIPGGDELLIRLLAARPGETIRLSVVTDNGSRQVELLVPPMRH